MMCGAHYKTVCDAYLITGCKLSVYDDLPWIRDLADFVGRAIADKKFLVFVLAINSLPIFLAGMLPRHQ